MAEAELGDDVWGEDPTAISLQEHCAELFGKEAGLYVPSGTMGNETALKTLTNPGDDVIVESRSHIVLYEHGAPSVISGVLLRLIETTDWPAPVATVADMIASANEHTARPSLVWQENTHNARGGRSSRWSTCGQSRESRTRAGRRSSSTAPGSSTPRSRRECRCAAFAAEVDALSFCFSKALGAPDRVDDPGHAGTDRSGADRAPDARRRDAPGRAALRRGAGGRRHDGRPARRRSRERAAPRARVRRCPARLRRSPSGRDEHGLHRDRRPRPQHDRALDVGRGRPSWRPSARAASGPSRTRKSIAPASTGRSRPSRTP